MTMDALAIDKLVEYLKFPTVHPNPNYSQTTGFLLKYAAEIGLESQVVECHKGKPVVIITWRGSKHGQLGSVLLNSHVDVVPVDESRWDYPPFEAKRVDGRIYARGSQDVKVLGVMHLEAIRQLKTAGFVPERTVHVSLVPDEEIGGRLGMALFVKSKEFADLNVAFGLDEGIPSTSTEMPVYYGERCPWWVEVTCRGDAGHGSHLTSNTAGEKMWRIVDRLMRFREHQKALLDVSHAKSRQLCDSITVNWTMLEGGNQANVIPAEMKAVFDIRLPPTIDLESFEQQLQSFCKEAAVLSGGSADSISYTFREKASIQAICDVSAEPAASFWTAMRRGIERCSLKTQLMLCYGTTDCRYLRDMGIPCLGFLPLPETKPMLHDHNENVSETAFLKGIQVFVEVIQEITKVK